MVGILILERWHLARKMRMFNYAAINSMAGVDVNKPPYLWISAMAAAR
jgi:hypothetical protein